MSPTLPTVPALVTGQVSHSRQTPLRHRFRYRVYQWLIDVDDPPNMPRWLRPFSRFDASDHLGCSDASIRQNVERFCASQGVEVAGQRILMLANARVLGYTFDPLTVFWVLAADGSVTCVIAEVHNTYAERHAYLLRPDQRGRAWADKAFYVSPFFSVDGRYDLIFDLDESSVSSTVVLRQEDKPVFTATFLGTPHPATARRLARLLITHPLMTQRTALLIRLHGVWLWLRRLPVVKRMPHHHQEAVR